MAAVNFPNSFSNGIILRGMPILSAYSGNVYWVHSGTGATTNNGKTHAKPLTTITAALAKCTDSKGDIIMCMPGHAETVDAAADIVVNKIGVAIVGLGIGTLRPTITFATDTLADIDITAANCAFVNFRFISNIASLDAPFDITAAGFTMKNCDFYCTTASTGFDITVITTTAANDLEIENCKFYYDYSLAGTLVTDTSTEIIRLVGADRAVIKGCYFAGNSTTAHINGITTESLSINISNNQFIQLATDKLWIDLVASCTGRIDYNVGTATSTAGVTDANIIDAASCQLAENYASDSSGETAQIVGVLSA